ncbi:MAG: WG repeat-containing protein [Prevotella sp.]|nr:WG repeat-containing protein [Prevotella sp.]
MKRVSARMFFTVLWRGLCQALGWFFGLFGYKRDGKFAKCVWGLFATSAAVVMGIIAIAVVYAVGDELWRWYGRQHRNCDDPYCYENTFVSRDIYFHNHDDGKGYIYNIRTGEKYLKHVAWIAKPTDKDSLICFSDGKKRGYFSKNTGKTVIQPKYNHAWIFSDGLASVEENGYIKFIDGTGKVVIDKKMAYIPGMDGYVFHGGYCVVDTDDGEQCGLMDKKGNIVLPLEYSSIYPTNDFKLWRLQKGNESAVIDSELKPILPLSECSIYIGDGTIDVTLPDHTMRKYDMVGTLINDFYIASFRMLEYEKEEIVYRKNTTVDDGDGIVEELEEYYHPKATARLRAYVAGDGFEGLITVDGHTVTMPLYKDIEAIGNDLYLCTSTNYDKVIVNGKGEIVR